MRFHIDTATIYVPDGTPVDAAVAKTTHMAIGAHQDDLEIMAYQGVVECFGKADKHFMGVVVTNGSGSPRDDLYADYTDDEMQRVRRVEQMKAAFVGEYCAQALLDFPSSAVKDGARTDVIEDIKAVLVAAKPKVVYTHNLADKHDTHVSVVLRTLSAIRSLPKDARPEKLYSCEVWRNLDWTIDSDKVAVRCRRAREPRLGAAGHFRFTGMRRQALRPCGDGQEARERDVLRQPRRGRDPGPDLRNRPDAADRG